MEHMIDNTERSDLMSFVVESYYDFVVALSGFKSLVYNTNIDNGILENRFRDLSGAFVKLYYMINAQLPNTGFMTRFDGVYTDTGKNIKKFNPSQAREFINRVSCLMSEYQSHLGEHKLLPLLNEKIGVEI